MKKFLTAFVFSVLVMALVVEAVFLRHIYLEDRAREEAKIKAVEEEVQETWQ